MLAGGGLVLAAAEPIVMSYPEPIETVRTRYIRRAGGSIWHYGGGGIVERWRKVCVICKPKPGRCV
jgi:hypothetical protein